MENLLCKCFSELDQESIVKTDSMQLLTNLCLLAYQLVLTSGLRVLDNGLGHGVWGPPEENIVDYALLADDQIAAFPSQVLAIFTS